MISLKIYLALSKLSDKELKRFEKFASSKFINGRDLSGIVKAIRSVSPKVSLHTSNKEYISLISGKLKIKESVTVNRLSDLNKLVEFFLILNITGSNKVRKNSLLLEYYLNEKNYSSFESVFLEQEKLLLNSKYSFNSLHNLAQLYEDASRKYFETFEYDKYLLFNQKKNDYSVADFIINFLRSSIEICQQNFYHKETVSGYSVFDNKIDIPGFIKNFKSEDVKADFLMQILYNSYLSYVNPDKEEYYFKTVKLHAGSNKYFDDLLNNFLYLLNINYCIHKINLKKYEFYNEAFQLINSKLKENLYSELRIANHLSSSFRNYINVGLRLNKYKWVNDFIDKYEKYLPAKIRNDDRNLNKAKLHIHKKEFPKALEYLNSVKKTNIFQYTDSSFLKIRLYYFMNKHEEALEEITRLKSYINYHRETPEFYLSKLLNHLKDSDRIVKYSIGLISRQDLLYYYSKRKFPPIPAWIDEIIMNLK
ncbi:MAG: hypothetical protein JNJ56_09435 [Ignavibacteria bacterium]|nr:hypothetical protein [Ignavibacteria bacterium]